MAMSPAPITQRIGVAELARLRGCSPRSLRNAAYVWRRHKDARPLGGIGRHAVKVGGALLWPADVVERWLRGELANESEVAR